MSDKIAAPSPPGKGTSLRAAVARQRAQARPARDGAGTRSCSWSRSAASLTTLVWLRDLVAARRGRRAALVHGQRHPLALVHGAVRELRRGAGRGPRQGAGGRAARPAPGDRRRASSSTGREERGPRLRRCARATWSWSRRARSIPGDGEVVEGIASVDESAITGESAPVIRESGGDRSAVTGGTKVLSDRIVVRITAEPGRVVPRPDDRAGRGREAAEDAERDRAARPARRADDHLPDRLRDARAVRPLLRRSRFSVDRDRGAARLPDPDHDRRAALRDRHRRHGPPDPRTT